MFGEDKQNHNQHRIDLEYLQPRLKVGTFYKNKLTAVYHTHVLFINIKRNILSLYFLFIFSATSLFRCLRFSKRFRFIRALSFSRTFTLFLREFNTFLYSVGIISESLCCSPRGICQIVCEITLFLFILWLLVVSELRSFVIVVIDCFYSSLFLLAFCHP